MKLSLIPFNPYARPGRKEGKMYSQKTKSGKYRFFESYTDPLTGIKRTVSVTLDKNTTVTRKAAQTALAARIDELTAGPEFPCILS